MKFPDLYYHGRRHDTECEVTRPDGLLLPRMLSIRNHSPCGFEWGFNGSGPAQLALALLYDWATTYSGVPCYSADDRQRCREFAHDNYQHFKNVLISCLSRQWDLHVVTVEDYLAWKAEALEAGDLIWPEWRRALVASGYLVAIRPEE